MKNAITYYYGLKPSEIYQVNKTYKFKIENINYILYPCDRNTDEIKQIYSLHLALLNSGYYCHHIIMNNNKEIITMVNNTQYILVKILIENRIININDIMQLNNIYVDEKKFIKLKRNDWYELWINKIDYIEYQINQFSKKFPRLRESCDYYIGIVENCISLLSKEKQNILIKTICHNRIKNGTTLYELYNPLNFIIDNRIRDAGEYFKLRIYEEYDITNQIKEYIYINKLSNEEIKMFFIRLLYPTKYFDTCEEIINNKKEENIIEEIIDKTDIYENNIKNIYNYLKTIIIMPEIEWLTKK